MPPLLIGPISYNGPGNILCHRGHPIFWGWKWRDRLQRWELMLPGGKSMIGYVLYCPAVAMPNKSMYPTKCWCLSPIIGVTSKPPLYRRYFLRRLSICLWKPACKKAKRFSFTAVPVALEPPPFNWREKPAAVFLPRRGQMRKLRVVLRWEQN